MRKEFAGTSVFPVKILDTLPLLGYHKKGIKQDVPA